MEYRLDPKVFYQQMHCLMTLAISRSITLLDEGQNQEARNLLAQP